MNPFGNKAISEIIVEAERAALEAGPPPKPYRQHAKDKNAKRRAKNKIANASRRKNRK